MALAAGAVVSAAAALYWTAPDWVVDALAARYPGCLYRVPTPRRAVALTLDDGPDPATTPRLLAALRRHGARATFFLIASRVRERDSLVAAIVEDGHEIGNHFMRDRPAIGLARGAFEADLLEAHRRLARYGPIRWARPGSGWYTRTMVATMERHGYRCALGSVYPLDAAVPSVSWAVRYILRNARPGAIVVLHDGGSRGARTARVLETVLPELRRRGYRVVSLSELVAGDGSDRPR